MRFSHLLVLGSYIFVFVHAPQEALSETAARYKGTGSCSSSNCHGSVNPIKGARILHNEYYTWQKHDPHSKAFSVLTQPGAQIMARHLGLGNPTAEPRCLACHATFAAEKAPQGERYSLEDGVSCESCHGAAERWLAPHAASNATHQQNIDNGMFDTVNLEKRAKLCLSCHQGDESKQVTHDLYGAGHPRLRFELDTYGMLQPKHWIVDEDYKNRKSDYIPIRAWLIGQVAQARNLVDILQNPHAQKGKVPELSVFDCYSCHHSLSQTQWKERSYAGQPGRLRINTTPFLLVQTALASSNGALANRLGQLTIELQTNYLKDSSSTTITTLSTLLAQEVLPVAHSMATDPQACRDTIQALSLLGRTTQPLKFELAEQIGMGIQAAAATHPGAIAISKTVPTENFLRTLFDTIKSPDTFSPSKFAKALPAY